MWVGRCGKGKADVLMRGYDSEPHHQSLLKGRIEVCWQWRFHSLNRTYRSINEPSLWLLLLSLVPRMGPCRGRGHDRNCSGGRWPLAGCRSYRGRGTERHRKTLRRPRDAGGLFSTCSPGSLCWHPAKGPGQTKGDVKLRNRRCKTPLKMR